MLLLATVLAATPERALAQFCLRGQPAPRCASFLVSEFMVGGRFAESDYAQTAWLAQWEFGVMVNRGASALGGTAMGGISGGGGRLALKARYRRWLGSSWGLDAGPGVIVLAGSGGQDARLRAPGFSGHVGLMWQDRAGVSLVLEAVPFRQPETGITGTDMMVGLGGRLGSPIGGALGALVFVGLVIVGAHLASITS